MSPHKYWHPVLRIQDLKSQPISVNFCGREVAIFRGKDGGLGAVEDLCAHRRMRLSKGKVQGNRLICPYHGWSYDPSGEGMSPGTPKLRPCVRAYEVAERYGAIWVKEFDSEVKLPDIGGLGVHQICTLHYRIHAPLELMVDNFSEIEHTCTTHILLGHDMEGMSSVESRTEVTDDQVRVVNQGPQKKMPYFLEKLLGYRKGDLFVGDGKIYFSPVCSVITNYWISASTKERRKEEVQGSVFFNPVNNQETDMMLFLFVSPKLFAHIPFFKPLLTFLIDYETKLDKRMIEGIADKNPTVAGMELGRFDQPLKPTRERIDRIYWGGEPSKLSGDLAIK